MTDSAREQPPTVAPTKPSTVATTQQQQHPLLGQQQQQLTQGQVPTTVVTAPTAGGQQVVTQVLPHGQKPVSVAEVAAANRQSADALLQATHMLDPMMSAMGAGANPAMQAMQQAITHRGQEAAHETPQQPTTLKEHGKMTYIDAPRQHVTAQYEAPPPAAGAQTQPKAASTEQQQQQGGGGAGAGAPTGTNARSEPAPETVTGHGNGKRKQPSESPVTATAADATAAPGAAEPKGEAGESAAKSTAHP